jgi:hypothetical protein
VKYCWGLDVTSKEGKWDVIEKNAAWNLKKKLLANLSTWNTAEGHERIILSCIIGI